MNNLAIASELAFAASRGPHRRSAHRGSGTLARDDAEERWSQLMAAAQAGDRTAYDRLLREIVPFIRTIAARCHKRHDRVDEVVQEVLLTLHRVRHSYDPARPFRHWLAAIAHRRSIDALRRHLRSQAHEIAEETVGPAYLHYADPASARLDETHAAIDQLGKAISGLPALQREAVELLKLREMSLAEAARATGRSVAALKVNAHRALKSLQRQMHQA